MKLIIDIPEKIEKFIKDYIPIGAGDNVFCYPDEIVRMIQNGTPIPDNATNGNVIKILFADFMYVPWKEWLMIDLPWWNAPYQKGE